jgi:hypothetical protein
MLRFSTLILVLFSSVVSSAWKDNVLNGVMELDQKLSTEPPFLDSFEFSLWSSIRSRVYDPDKKTRNVSSRFLQKKVKVAYQIKDNNEPVLYVYIPGIFNNVSEGQTRRAFTRMASLGKNVLVLPNPWGTDYISAKPLHKPGDILREAESLHDITLSFIASSGLPKQAEVRLFGASYGGFLATVFANVDRDLGTDIVHPEVYVFSPPLNMRETISNIDQLMFEDDFFNQKVSDTDLAFLFLDYVFAKNFEDLDAKTRILSQVVAVREGFKTPFRDALSLYFKEHPDFLPNKKDYYFSSYLKSLAPELEELLRSQVSDISYWVEEGVGSGLDIKVLSTTNDFLNSYVWPGSYNQRHFWFFQNGGHLGFIEMIEFEKFLRTTLLKERVYTTSSL